MLSNKEETPMPNSQRAFELLQSGDTDALRQLIEHDPGTSEARDATGVNLLMHSLYRGRRDLAELIASKKKTLDIFEATALGRLDRLKEILRDASLHDDAGHGGRVAPPGRLAVHRQVLRGGRKPHGCRIHLAVGIGHADHRGVRI